MLGTGTAQTQGRTQQKIQKKLSRCHPFGSLTFRQAEEHTQSALMQITNYIQFINLQFSSRKNFFLIYLFYLFYFFGCIRSLLLRGLSLVAASGGYSSLWCVGFSLRWLLLLWSTGSRRVGFSSCGLWAQQLWHTGLVAPRHVRYSQTGARTRGKGILNHCATREAPRHFMIYTLLNLLRWSILVNVPCEPEKKHFLLYIYLYILRYNSHTKNSPF